MSERTLQGHAGHATFQDGTDEVHSAVRSFTLPDVIDGRYRVLGRVGSGSMGIVLRAEDLFLQRPVAIKIVEPGLDPQITERFIKEAQALAQVRHENVVQVYAFGRFQTASYLAMELVVGHSLESIIDAHSAATNTIALPRAMSILRSIALGLDAVHARQLVHRDVKPANVIIEKNSDRPVLIDFGLARRRTASNPRMSISGGTPSYMAPEQAQDPLGVKVGPRTDIYAFACTAFEVLTNRPVFEGTDIFSVLLGHLNEQPRRISSVRPELAPLDEVLLRSLAKNPEERHASATELMTALEARALLIGAPAPATGPRVLFLATDQGFRRTLVRNTTQTLKAKGHAIAGEESESAIEAIALAGSRDFPATTAALGSHRVRHLVPKPLNVHVLAAVLGRTTLAT